MIDTMIGGTPAWVLFIFAYLVLRGIFAFKTRTVYIPKLFIVPSIFIGLKYKLIMAGSFSMVLSYFICLGMTALVSYLCAARHKVLVIKESMSVTLPGTYMLLVIYMAFFAIKYVFGFLQATDPALYNKVHIFELLIGALFSGYFLGKALLYLKRAKE